MGFIVMGVGWVSREDYRVLTLDAETREEAEEGFEELYKSHPGNVGAWVLLLDKSGAAEPVGRYLSGGGNVC